MFHIVQVGIFLDVGFHGCHSERKVGKVVQVCCVVELKCGFSWKSRSWILEVVCQNSLSTKEVIWTPSYAILP